MTDDGLLSLIGRIGSADGADMSVESLNGFPGRGRAAASRLGPEWAPVRDPADALALKGTAWLQQALRDGEVARVVQPLRRRIKTLEAERASSDAMLAMHPDPILLVDAGRIVVRGNEAALRLLGDNLLRRDLGAVLTDPAVLTATDGVLAGAGPAVVDFQLRAPTQRHFRCRIQLLPNAPRQDVAALLTITDFTEVKRAEQARADFVANASHELRTPLAILMGFIETLAGSAADDPEAQQRFLAIMQQQGARMARLVEDLLALSRIELTEHAPPTTQVQLPGLLSAVSQALRLRAAERGMRIDLAVACALPAVIGDSDELSQVFQNLIDNAIKYAAPQTAIEVTARPSDKIAQGVAVAVRDHGEGIAERHLPRLTERFYRVDTARSYAAGGTGLGLAIVKHVLTRHRGLLEVESQVGVGSTFTVHLCGLGNSPEVEPAGMPAPIDHHGAGDGERLENTLSHRQNNRRPAMRGRPSPLRIVDRTTNHRTG